MHPIVTILSTVYSIIKLTVFALTLLVDLTRVAKAVILVLRTSKHNQHKPTGGKANGNGISQLDDG
jgi:hypothetical protein